MKYLKVDDQVFNIIRGCSGKVNHIIADDFIVIEYSDGSIENHVYNGMSKFVVKMTDKEQVITFDIPALEPKAPKAGTLVVVSIPYENVDLSVEVIRVSSGYINDGCLMVYDKGRLYGPISSPHSKWRLYNRGDK